MFTTAPQPKLNTVRKVAIKELIHQFSFEDMMEVAEEYGGLSETGSAADLRNEIYQTVIDCCELDGGDSSDIRLDGMDWKGVITGGMSHGDHPTDSYETVALIGRFDPLWDLLKHFAQEDFAALRKGGPDVD